MAGNTGCDVAEAKTSTCNSHQFSISDCLLSLCIEVRTSLWQTFKISHNVVNTSEMRKTRQWEEIIKPIQFYALIFGCFPTENLSYIVLSNNV
jgi:hypothetical protein